jgi:hypothetical protein
MVVRGGEKCSTISPELSPIAPISPELSPIAPKLDLCYLTLQEEAIGFFEGKTFFLMGTSFLEKQNQQHRAAEPPSITTFEDPVANDKAMTSQLRQAWEQGFAQAVALATPLPSADPLPSQDDDGLGFWNQSHAFVV